MVMIDNSRGNPIFTSKGESLREAVKEALEQGVDLSGANLRGADLKDLDLSAVSLYGTNLSCADLTGADLHLAKLRASNLERACLRDADISGADLGNTILTLADFTGACLSRVNLEGAWPGNAIFRKAYLKNVFIKGRSQNPSYMDFGRFGVLKIEEGMWIGSRYQTRKEWDNFSDERIAAIDPYVLEVWREYKDRILA
jgi:uncharacterized protein YjbI with pentapeptide repeats